MPVRAERQFSSATHAFRYSAKQHHSRYGQSSSPARSSRRLNRASVMATSAVSTASHTAAAQYSPKRKKSGGQSGNLDLPELLDVPGSGPSRILNISYEGPLRGLLDNVAIASGYGWDFDAKTNTVVFSRLSVRTFTILGAPGKREYKDNITNKSRETTRSSIGGSNVNATVATSDTSSQTAQANTTDYKFDIWADTEKAVKALLLSLIHI